MNTSEKIKELESLRAKVAALEANLASVRQKELAALPERYGFANVADFIAAFRAATGTRPGRKPKSTAPAGPKRGRRKRSVITDETRAQVKKMVAQEKTGAAIAQALGISLPSVQNIKKALGLVKERK
jgi:DNA-binding CsgD family transcriptional regulator